MRGSKRELRPDVWELRVPTGKRRAPTDAAKAKAAELSHKAYGTSIMHKATFSTHDDHCAVSMKGALLAH
jgi:hypothetical protein